jgi:MEMO1 family protein
LRAVIGPHAGFSFSGPTAAWAYKNIDANDYDRVVLLGPSHKVHLDFIGTTTCSEWATPLGNLRIDSQTIAGLVDSEDVKKAGITQIGLKYEEAEHSLEMHIPYIQKIFKDANKEFVLVPLMVGDMKKDRLPEFAQRLLNLW